MELLLAIALLVSFDCLSLAYAYDSRETSHSAEHQLALRGYEWPE